MKIKDLKDFNKPVNKLLTLGVSNLSNEELLAILINNGTREESCMDISRNILNSISSLNELLNINITELMKFKGIKEKKAALIIAAIELFKRSIKDYKYDVVIYSKEVFYNIVKKKIKGINVEHIFIGYLNSKLKLIYLQELEGGSPNNIVFPIRNIVKKALDLDAVSVVISHNHPSGDTMPSEADIKATLKLQKALNNVDISLLDHLVVSESEYTSIFELIDN